MTVRLPAATSCLRLSLVAFVFLVGCNALSGASDFGVTSGASPVDSELYAGKVDEDDETPGEPSLADGGQTLAQERDASSSEDAGTDSGQPLATKRVFVTTATTTGNMGGRAGADGKCATAAAAGGLSGHWIAWVSVTNGKAVDRITHTGAYVLLDGTQVVANKAQLTSGSISHAINVTEKNVALSANKGVWTGTRPDGYVDATCNDWTSSSTASLGTLASAIASDIGWTKGAPQSGQTDNWKCDTVVSLYCFEL